MYKDNVRHEESDNSRAISDRARLWNHETLRVMDIDQFGYCRKCFDVIYITEATSSREKSNFVVRNIAQKLGAVSIFIRHDWEDWDHKYPIYLAAWRSDDSLWQALTKTEWSSYDKLVENATILHEREKGCHSGKKRIPFMKGKFEGSSFDANDFAEALDYHSNPF